MKMHNEQLEKNTPGPGAVTLEAEKPERMVGGGLGEACPQFIPGKVAGFEN